MSCKTIVVYVEPGEAGDARADAAIRLAQRFDARLTGVALAAQPMPLMTEGAAVAADVWAQELRRSEEAAKRDADAFVARAGRAGRAGAEGRVSGGAPDVSHSFAVHARYADLAVVGAPRASPAEGLAERVLESALFDSGRPVLVLPEDGGAERLGERALVAWDAGREAAVAAAAALPFLTAAAAVRLTVARTFFGSARHGEDPGVDAARWLAAHGVEVEVETLSTDGASVAEALLTAADAFGADMIVMGGYGHSRLREAIFGGVTSALLAKSHLPLLMAH